MSILLVMKNINDGQVPFRLVVQNVPNLLDIQVDDPKLYGQAPTKNELSVDSSIIFV